MRELSYSYYKLVEVVYRGFTHRWNAQNIIKHLLAGHLSYDILQIEDAFS